MKNVGLIFLLMIAGVFTGYGQNEGRVFKPFKVGIGLGYAMPQQSTGASGGALVYLEPAYRASDLVSIGLRLESAFMVRGVQGVNSNNDVTGNATANMSYTLN